MVAIKVGKHKRLEKDKLITTEKGHTTGVDTIHDIRYSENFVIFFLLQIRLAENLQYYKKSKTVLIISKN